MLQGELECARKKGKYRTPQEAREAAQKYNETHVDKVDAYYCPHKCGYFHIGHQRTVRLQKGSVPV